MNFLNKITILSAIVILSTIFTTTAGKKHGKSTEQGPNLKNKHKHNKYLNKGATVDCFQAYEKCRQTPKCKTALHALNKKCQVLSIRCTIENESDELNKCGEVMDDLFLYGFPENRCGCNHNWARCFKMLNKIYANPCFAAVRKHREDEKRKTMLKNQDLILLDDLKVLSPRLQPLKDRETGVLHSGNGMETNNTESNDGPQSANSLNIGKESSEEILIIPEFTQFNFEDQVLEEEIVFGDEGFAKPPPRRKTPPPTVETEKKDKPDNSDANKNEFDSDTTPKSTKLNNKEISHNQGKTKKLISPNNEDPNSSQSEEDNSDIYRAVGIALGLSLGISIIVIVIYFILKRAKATLLYKNGRIVRKISENGGSSARLKSDSSFSPSRA